MLKKLVIAAALALVALAPASAHHANDDAATKAGLKVSHAWTAANSSMAHAIQVYATLWNEGETPDTLVDVHVPFAEDAAIQTQEVAEDGTLEVREVKQVALQPGQAVTMHPQGLHLVFNDVQKVLRPGDTFHAHFEFAKAGELEVEVHVMAPDEAEEMM